MTPAERIGYAVLAGWGFHGMHERPCTSFGTSTYVIGFTRPGIPAWRKIRTHGSYPNNEWEHALLDEVGVPRYDKAEPRYRCEGTATLHSPHVTQVLPCVLPMHHQGECSPTTF